jgi:hypothetical protein
MSLPRREFLGLVAGLTLEAKKKAEKEKEPDPVWQAGVAKWLRSAQENNKEIAEVFLHSSTGESSLDNFKIGTADSVNMTGQIKYLANKLQQGFWVVDVHIHPINTLKKLHKLFYYPKRPKLISPPNENAFTIHGQRGDIAYSVLQRVQLQAQGVAHEALVHGVVDNSGIWLFNINMQHPLVQAMSELLRAQAKGDNTVESLERQFIKRFGAELENVRHMYKEVFDYNEACLANGEGIYGEMRHRLIHTVISRLNTVGVNMVHYDTNQALKLNKNLIVKALA